MQIRGFLENWIGAGHGLLSVLWVYLTVSGRFLRWRLRFWLLQFGMVESTQTRMKRTLLIIRHGQTTWNVEHRLPGQVSGVVLSDIGCQQVARLAEALSVLPLSAIISSPLERALQTAEIIANGRNLQIQHEPDLMDTDVGRWAGQTIEEISKNDPAWKEYVRDPTTAPEGIETFPQVQQRVVAAIERWLAKDDLGAYPVFVAHADVVKLIIAHYSGLETKRAGTLMIDNASVSLLELEQEQHPRVVSIGWSPHPGWLKPPQLEAPKSIDTAQEVGEQKT